MKFKPWYLICCVFLFSTMLCSQSMVVVLPVSAAGKSTQRRPGKPSELEQLKLTQAVMLKFISFLDSDISGDTVTDKQADLKTLVFVNTIQDKRVLADIAISAETKLGVYSMMPPNHRALWQSLYRNCVARIGSPEPIMRARMDRSSLVMKRTTPDRRYSERDLLLNYKKAHQVLDVFLDQIGQVKANPQLGVNFEKNNIAPLIAQVDNIDVLTDIARSAHSKFELYAIFFGTDYFFNLFSDCVVRIATFPRADALDVMSYFHDVLGGGSATSELLNDCIAGIKRGTCQ